LQAFLPCQPPLSANHSSLLAVPLSLHLRAGLLGWFTRRAREGTSSAFGWAGLSACDPAWLSASSGLLSSVNASIGFVDYYLQKNIYVKSKLLPLVT
jgi:hypothetical protein